MPNNREAMVAKLGSEEAYLAWLKASAAKGGRKKIKKGFATLTPEDRSKRARAAAQIRWSK